MLCRTIVIKESKTVGPEHFGNPERWRLLEIVRKLAQKFFHENNYKTQPIKLAVQDVPELLTPYGYVGTIDWIIMRISTDCSHCRWCQREPLLWCCSFSYPRIEDRAGEGVFFIIFAPVWLRDRTTGAVETVAVVFGLSNCNVSFHLVSITQYGAGVPHMLTESPPPSPFLPQTVLNWVAHHLVTGCVYYLLQLWKLWFGTKLRSSTARVAGGDDNARAFHFNSLKKQKDLTFCACFPLALVAARLNWKEIHCN